ncbi:MFS general substrate transporter domain-containing protein [Dioscorea alata]|uniref:MFS general substrate transporter domain-containing protein n=1 Tax=Dioscorea alata TaxID=55571 RepID=A0ACB7WF26_DIOAL|nr:MFS general substrate transporter domain-containing protein [Dioscorea alata]
MNRTGRWWRLRRRGAPGELDDDDPFSLASHDDLQPMDTQEQEDMILSLEKNHAQQNRLWRGVFAAFLIGYAAFSMYSAFYQALFPWDLRFHAYFMEEMHPWIVILADWVAVLACLFAVKGLVDRSSSYQQWFWFSCYASLFLTVFWLYYMLRLPKFRWDVIWLPFGPLSGSGICFYIDHLLKDSFEDIRKLRGYMYNYKTI